MTPKLKTRIKPMPWKVVVDDLRRRGNWILVGSTPSSKIFERGNERLVAVKLRKEMWKAEYFQRGRLEDVSGTADEEFIKLMVYEMGVYRR